MIPILDVPPNLQEAARRVQVRPLEPARFAEPEPAPAEHAEEVRPLGAASVSGRQDQPEFLPRECLDLAAILLRQPASALQEPDSGIAQDQPTVQASIHHAAQGDDKVL